MVKIEENLEFLPLVEGHKFLKTDAWAFYNPMEHKVYYDVALDNYPDFKKVILEHEFSHSRHPHNYFYHMWIDMRDRIFFKFHKDYVPFLKETETTTGEKFKPKSNWEYVPLFIYVVVNQIWSVVILPIDLIVYLKLLLFDKKKKEEQK